MRVLALDPFQPIVITGHAEQRIRQRVGKYVADDVEREIRRAIRLCDVEWVGRNRFLAKRSDRVYVVAKQMSPTRALVVVTVLLPVLAAAA